MDSRSLSRMVILLNRYCGQHCTSPTNVHAGSAGTGPVTGKYLRMSGQRRIPQFIHRITQRRAKTLIISLCMPGMRSNEHFVRWDIS